MKPRATDLLVDGSRAGSAPAPTIPRRLADALEHAVGTAARGRFEQAIYSLTHLNHHFQNVAVELERLGVFLAANGVAVRTALDVGCGDGAISVRLQRMLGLPEIAGVELNRKLAGEARSRGVSVIEADMDAMPVSGTYDLVISYGSLHHSPDTSRFVRRLRALTSRYVLIVDNTVRATPLHRVTGSAWFPLELSPYPIRSAGEIEASVRDVLDLVGAVTFRHANIWHDRSFFLAEA